MTSRKLVIVAVLILSMVLLLTNLQTVSALNDFYKADEKNSTASQAKVPIKVDKKFIPSPVKIFYKADEKINASPKLLYSNYTFFIDGKIATDGKQICDLISETKVGMEPFSGAVRFDKKGYKNGDSGTLLATIFKGKTKNLDREFICARVYSTSDEKGVPVVLVETSPSRHTYQSISYLQFNPDVTDNYIFGPELKVSDEDKVFATLNNLENVSNRPVPISTAVVNVAEGFGSTTTYPPVQFPTGQLRPTCSLYGGDSGDNDYICYGWENQGQLIITISGNTYSKSCGGSDPCPSPTVKDVYLEIDSWSGYAPTDTAISNVINAFKCDPTAPLDAPYTRLCTGSQPNIVLHVQKDAATTTPAGGDVVTIPDELSSIKSAKYASELSTQPQKDLKSLVYHWMYFANGIAGDLSSSGTGEIWGNDAIVTLGNPAFNEASDDQVGGTMMHELGHNLNLYHGGGSTVDINCKPNYLSVMNYPFQISFFINRPLDYSQSTLATLNEGTPLTLFLDENAGVQQSTPQGRHTVFGPPALGTLSVPIGGVNYPYRESVTGSSINWDGTGGLTSSATADINYLGIAGCPSSPGQSLVGFTDWSNLKYNFRTTSNFAPGAAFIPDTVTELNGDDVREVRKIGVENIITEIQNLPDDDFGQNSTASKAKLISDLEDVKNYVSNDDLRNAIIKSKSLESGVSGNLTSNPSVTKINDEIENLRILFKKGTDYTSVRFTDFSLPIQDNLIITVEDPDGNNDPDTINLGVVQLISPTDPNGIQTSLVETGDNTGIFVGEFDISTQHLAGKLQVSEGDTVLAEYDNGTFTGSFQVEK